jgi:hypothetical protein
MENNHFYVYCHRKKDDGKCFYIGKGCFKRYKSKQSRNQYWHNIVNKHGFTWEILINNISEEKAFELESIICEKIGYENLCNMRSEKGDGGYGWSEESLLKIKNTWSNKSKEEVEKINNKRRLGNLGKPKLGSGRKFYTEEEKIQHSKILIGTKKPNNNRAVQMIDSNKNIIKEFNSIYEAAYYINVQPSSISFALMKEGRKSGKYFWKYKN